MACSSREKFNRVSMVRSVSLFVDSQSNFLSHATGFEYGTFLFEVVAAVLMNEVLSVAGVVHNGSTIAFGAID